MWRYTGGRCPSARLYWWIESDNSKGPARPNDFWVASDQPPPTQISSWYLAIVTKCRSETTISRNLLLAGEKPLIIQRTQLPSFLLPVHRIDMNEKESDGRENQPPRIQQTLILKTKLKVLKKYENWAQLYSPNFSNTITDRFCMIDMLDNLVFSVRWDLCVCPTSNTNALNKRPCGVCLLWPLKKAALCAGGYTRNATLRPYSNA